MEHYGPKPFKKINIYCNAKGGLKQCAAQIFIYLFIFYKLISDKHLGCSQLTFGAKKMKVELYMSKWEKQVTEAAVGCIHSIFKDLNRKFIKTARLQRKTLEDFLKTLIHTNQDSSSVLLSVCYLIYFPGFWILSVPLQMSCQSCEVLFDSLHL